MMRLGAADSGSALSLEAMSYPNHYLAHDHTDVIVLQPVRMRGAKMQQRDVLAVVAGVTGYGVVPSACIA